MRLLLFIVVSCVLLARISAKKEKYSDKLEELLKKTKQIEENNKAELEEEAQIEDDEEDEDDDDYDTTTTLAPPLENPCNKKRCSWGKECVLNKKNKARCQCADKCPTPKPTEAVCSSHNQTFDSICALYRQRCMCKSGDTRCEKESNAKVHLEFMGKCKVLDECTEDMMVQFPERMSDWLFQVMKELNRREELNGNEWEVMANQAEADSAVRHIYPVIWKYCQLDRTPHDSHVSHHELIPLIAPVMPMESCIKPFLKKCDQDDDHKITLKEWGMCLGLKADDIIEKC